MKYPLAVVRLLSPAALLALSSIIHPLSSASAATAYLPETSPRTIVASPLAAGEVSVVREQGGTATIYIGGDTGGVVRVAEPTGIRGWRVEDIPADELAIVTENVTVTNGAYLVNGMNTTGIVSVVASGGENIVEYDYDSAMGDGGISPEQAYLVPRAEGPELRFWIVPRANGWVSISNIVCRRVAFGDTPVENDLLRTRYSFRDNLGTWELGGLREWTKHLYDGNRGEDWAAYSAKRHVSMNGNALVFDRASRFSAAVSTQTNFVLQAFGRSAITIGRGSGGTSTYTYFAITDIDVTSAPGGVVLSYAHDISGFSAENMGVLYAETLDGAWLPLPEDEFSIADNGDGTGTVTVPSGRSAATGFYKLMYHGATTAAVRVTIRGTVVVPDALILRGTDSKYWKIKVTGGTLSAEEVTL